MLSNLHTHSTFCDGKDSPEEIIKFAIERGFDSLGFSSHMYTGFDVRYCMVDILSYIGEINLLKEKYKNQIQIYCGIEEDAFQYCDRKYFDYIIGSSHYICRHGKYFPVDSTYGYFLKCLELFNNNPIELAENYFQEFCKYILDRKPDIIGHFDYLTKFEEKYQSVYLTNEQYLKLSKKYLRLAAQSECIFEVNTGAIARGFRTSPYPQEYLLYELNKLGGKVTITSDCHDMKKLDCNFNETKKMLYDIGFRNSYVLYDGKFREDRLL